MASLLRSTMGLALVSTSGLLFARCTAPTGPTVDTKAAEKPTTPARTTTTPVKPASQGATGTQQKPVIPPPDPAAAEVPSGYRVDVAASQLMYPTSVELDADGAMYIAEAGYMPGDAAKPPARVLKIGPAGAGSSAPSRETVSRETVADGLSAPVTDILWHEGKLYISHRGKISVLSDGRVTDLVTDLPSFGDHSNNQLAIGSDGKLYFGLGSATNAGVVGVDNFAFGWPKEHPEVCDVPGRDVTLRGQTFETDDPRSTGKKVSTSAFQPFGKTVPAGTVVPGKAKANSAVLRMDLDGSNVEVFAWGFRNPYGAAFGPDGNLYVADAGCDERGSRHIRDEPEKLWNVKQGAFYGWPDFAAGIAVTEARFQPKKSAPLKLLLEDHPTVEKPVMTFDVHASITQIDVCRSAQFGFEGQLFMGASGDQSAVTAADEVRAGYWVKRVDVASRKAETFFRTKPAALGPRGLEYVTTAGPKRIVDVRFSPDGRALYVVDIGPLHYVRGPDGPKPMAFPGTGVVWRITRG